MAPQQSLTDEEKSTLIIMVRSRSLLYNDSEKGKSSAKKDSWAEIAKAMSTPERELGPDFISSQWKNLRDTFIRQHRNCSNSSSSTWKYYEKMTFLLSQPSIVNVTENKGEKKEKPPKEPKKKAEKRPAVKEEKKSVASREPTPVPRVKAEPIDPESELPCCQMNDDLTINNTAANATTSGHSMENVSLMSDDSAPPAKIPRLMTSNEFVMSAIESAAAVGEEARVLGSTVSYIYESVKQINPEAARLLRRQLLTLAIACENSLDIKKEVEDTVERVLIAVENTDVDSTN